MADSNSATSHGFTVLSAGFAKARTGLRSLGIKLRLDIDSEETEYGLYFPMSSDDPETEPLGITRVKELAPVLGMKPKTMLAQLSKQDNKLLKKFVGVEGDALIVTETVTNVATGDKDTTKNIVRVYFGDNDVTEDDVASVEEAADKWLD
jgi:hypothetical protein